MKFLERAFYGGRLHFGSRSLVTIKNWFRVKDNAFRGIKRVAKRHRRSISVRDVGRLYGTDIDWLQSKIDHPRWSLDRSVYRKSKDGTVWYGALKRIYFYEDK